MQSKVSINDRNETETYTLDNFPYLKEVRNYMVKGPIEFCMERALLKTQFLKKKGGLDYKDSFTRTAESLKYILKNKKPNIFSKELIAGSTTSKRKGVLFFPEYIGGGIWPDLFSMSERKKNKYRISIEEILKIDEILDFWTDKNVLELVRRKLGDDDASYKLQMSFFVYFCLKINCVSHTIPDYKSILEYGLEGLIKKAKDKILSSDDSVKKIFYRGLITVMEGVIKYSNNLSIEARQQAKECSDEIRKNQLNKMADICSNVPAKPASGFWEAIQSIWTTMNALYQENTNAGFSIGRIDHLLNKYYVKDLEKGRITRKKAIKLLGHFWVKVGDNIPMIPEFMDLMLAGTGSNQAITIGGCDQDGNNVVNETTFLCLDVAEMLHMRDPNLNARVRMDDPSEYTKRLFEVIINTGATPSLVNDQVVIPALEKTGITLSDARDYAQVGCLEPNSAGRHFGHTGAILINTVTAMILTLNNGNARDIENLGLKTGKLEDFETFAQFLEAVKEQLKYLIKNATKFNNICGEVLRYLNPQPLLSAIFEGPMDSGKMLLDGGATYNSTGIFFIGLADITDSLYAIKKLIYDDKKLSFQEIIKILESDFNGYEYVYNYVINKLDHYGNDIKAVDDIAKEIVSFVYDECRNIMNYREGVHNPGYWSMSVHSGYGKMTGAFPHGKKAGEPLASGMTPISSCQKNGPTGVFNSVAYLDNTKMPNGMALNMKFNKSLFKTKEKINSLISLIKSYFKKGGMHILLTIQDAHTLIKAKKHPEKYPDLMVRISGYTAYFVDLTEHMMDEIINRALMKL